MNLKTSRYPNADVALAAESAAICLRQTLTSLGNTGAVSVTDTMTPQVPHVGILSARFEVELSAKVGQQEIRLGVLYYP